MKLLIAAPRGFCAGVERAIRTVEVALGIYPHPVYVKHEIVHNKHVIQDLEQKGAIFIEDLSQVPEGRVLIYSAHGVSPEVRKEAQKRKLIEIDATCGLVTKVHSAAKRFASRGYQIILIGHKNHVEVIGTAGEAPGSTHIVETAQDVDQLSFSAEDRLCYLTQTTLSVNDVQTIRQRLLEKYPSIETLPSSSICYATTNRQKALQQFAKKTDIFLVVGDPTSSNSNRLREIAEDEGARSYLINDEVEIDPSWLFNCKVIGLSAGASTPEAIVEKCISRLESLGVEEIEEIRYKEENVFFDIPKKLQVLI
ncbi:MAG: 4-hydroxy-3-methylbut-2-enyl diphosphate reductase [Chlamydiota bacterium]